MLPDDWDAGRNLSVGLQRTKGPYIAIATLECFSLLVRVAKLASNMPARASRMLAPPIRTSKARDRSGRALFPSRALRADDTGSTPRSCRSPQDVCDGRPRRL